MTKSELIKKLQDIPGDPDVCVSVFGHASFPGERWYPGHEPVTVEPVRIHFGFPAENPPRVVVLIRHGKFPSGSGYLPEPVEAA